VYKHFNHENGKEAKRRVIVMLSNDHDENDDVCDNDNDEDTVMFEFMIMMTLTIMFVRICDDYDDHVDDNADNHDYKVMFVVILSFLFDIVLHLDFRRFFTDF
jgi:hypothetical protein